MPNWEQKYGAGDEPRVGDGGGGYYNDANKKRSIANILTSHNAPSHNLSLLELNGENQKDGDEDEVESKRHASYHAEVGGVDALPHPHKQPRLWVKDRMGVWWKQCNSPDYPEAEFHSAFRMSRATFNMICDALGSAIAKEDTKLRAAIPVRQRVAICIQRFATGHSLRDVAKDFGIGVSTCQKIVLEVCVAIRSLLMPRFLKWPDKDSAFKASFAATYGVPDVVGAMFTTHIPIVAPKISTTTYLNRHRTKCNKNKSYSIALQGVVGPDGTFTDVCIGWPGSMPNDQILEKSALKQRADDGMMAGSWVVGGTSYPLTDWVLVPYTHQNLTSTQRAFNEKIAKLRCVVLDAFTRLKGRWVWLQKRTEVKPLDLPVMLGACCVLHNICEVRGEEMDPMLQCDLSDNETVLENPVRSESASKSREKIAHNLLDRDLGSITS